MLLHAPFTGRTDVLSTAHALNGGTASPCLDRNWLKINGTIVLHLVQLDGSRAGSNRGSSTTTSSSGSNSTLSIHDSSWALGTTDPPPKILRVSGSSNTNLQYVCDGGRWRRVK
jgi:hypothetical protein